MKLEVNNHRLLLLWSLTISSGPFKGISGTVTRTDGRRFLVVESGLNGILLKIDMERNVVE